MQQYDHGKYYKVAQKPPNRTTVVSLKRFMWSFQSLLAVVISTSLTLMSDPKVYLQQLIHTDSAPQHFYLAGTDFLKKTGWN